MKTLHPMLRFGALCAALSFLLSSNQELRAQPSGEAPVAKMTVITPEEGGPSPTELMKSYTQVREQLHAAQLAIMNNRLEAETTARAQAAAIADKLDALTSAMASERERHRDETQLFEGMRQRQQSELERSHRTIFWIASAFGIVGLLALVFTTMFQWRADKLMSAMNGLTPSSRSDFFLTDHSGPAERTLSLANQRLLSAVDRMERRIFELESASASAAPRAANTVSAPPETPLAPAASAAADQSDRITALLGKGRSLMKTNKANEAIVCYDEILEVDPNHPEALVRKGAALEQLKLDPEAIACYDRAIKADRKMTLAYLNKGGLFNRLERFDEAVECYELALQASEGVK